MSRLLFAAARGARVQVMSDNNWYGITQIYMPFRRDARAIRIHPDDAHVAYGPISTALREIDNPRNCVYDFDWRIQYYFAEYLEVNQEYWHGSDLHRSLFLLILAEALADEGL